MSKIKHIKLTSNKEDKAKIWMADPVIMMAEALINTYIDI